MIIIYILFNRMSLTIVFIKKLISLNFISLLRNLHFSNIHSHELNICASVL